MQADLSRPLLAIDSSTAFLSLALRHAGQCRRQHIEAGARASALILPHIRQLLAEAGIGVADLGAIVYAQGPGAFTGLRIGIGVAQGLAAPFDLPLIGVPCLDAVASLLPGRPCVLAATDARMGELFYAWYDTAAGRRLSDYRVGAATEIVLPPPHQQGEGVGNAFALPVALPVPGHDAMPTAADYLALAAAGNYAATSAADAALVYVRDKVALTAAEQAARKAAP